MRVRARAKKIQPQKQMVVRSVPWAALNFLVLVGFATVGVLYGVPLYRQLSAVALEVRGIVRDVKLSLDQLKDYRDKY